MNILITSGGTREEIDKVRSITNTSTGRLGSIIADYFAKHCEKARVTCIHGETAVLPTTPGIELLPVSNVQSLLETIDTLLITRKFDCIILAMAVSDYTPAEILDSGGNPLLPGESAKVSSDHDELLIRLVRTPKVIERFKEIKIKQPKSILVGFKLLSGVTEQVLLQTGHRLLEQNNCDFVLANDLADVAPNGKMHKAMLIDKCGILFRARTKHEIAQIIYNSVTKAKQEQPRRAGFAGREQQCNRLCRLAGCLKSARPEGCLTMTKAKQEQPCRVNLDDDSG
jgi:phosphopantothenate-cysteine ligase